MQLKVIGSSSRGNAYILENSNEALMLECGVNFASIKAALDFRVNKVVGCLVTHEHQDHGGFAREVTRAGIMLYASAGTIDALHLNESHRAVAMKEKALYHMGNFSVMPFGVKHDAAEPFGFLIDHPENGVTVFTTDTYFLPFKFAGMNNIIAEVNYDLDILDNNVLNGRIPSVVRKRVLRSHMSIETFKGFLAANDLSGVNNIVMIHLSDGNSHAAKFKKEIEDLTGKTVHIAEPSMTIDFGKTPF